MSNGHRRNVWGVIGDLESELAELRKIVDAVKADVDELSGKQALDFPIPPFPRALKALGYKPLDQVEAQELDAPFDVEPESAA